MHEICIQFTGIQIRGYVKLGIFSEISFLFFLRIFFFVLLSRTSIRTGYLFVAVVATATYTMSHTFTHHFVHRRAKRKV